MKGIKYSKGYKGLLVVFEHIFVVVFTICLCISAIYSGGNRNFFEIVRRKPFIETERFSDMFQTDVHNIVQYSIASSNFEEDGSYAPDKLVDIMEYSKNGRIDGKLSGGVGYTLEELYDWSQGTEYRDIYVCEKKDDTYDYFSGSEFRKLQNKGEISKDYYDGYDREVEGKPNKESTDKKRVYKRVWLLDSGMKEDYKAIVDKKGTRMSLIELANTDSSVNGHLDEYFRALGNILADFQNEIMKYKDMKSRYAAHSTNLSFLYYDDLSGNICTNTSYNDKDQVEIFANWVKKGGKYLIFRSRELDLDTNLASSRRELLEFSSGLIGGRKGNNVLIIRLDTDFPTEDSYQTAAKQYDRLQPWLRMLLGAGCVSLIGFFICLIELTLRAGRRQKNGEVVLNRLDTLRTELLLAGVILAITVELGFFNAFGPWGTFDTWAFACIGLCVLVTNAIILTGYLSFIRRIKAETLWSNSILAQLIEIMKTVIANRKVTTKALLAYILFIFLNIILCASGIGIFLAIILDVSVGTQLMKDAVARKEIMDGIQKITDGHLEYKINTNNLKADNRKMAEAVNNIGAGLQNAVEASMKNERLKTDLITNVSHDIKTPLTSIINYVDLLKRENIEDERVRGYLDVLNDKAQRLKNLTEDLVEASKVSSGNVKIEFTRLNFVELINQTAGEFDEKFAARDLQLIMQLPDSAVVVLADGRRLWRVLENLYNNVAKYAMQGTRVYAGLRVAGEYAEFSIKNISEQPLNINADELTERFIRGDVSRSTEGSGLGLSIAKNLTELQHGQFEIYLDGDLFKVTVRFPVQFVQENRPHKDDIAKQQDAAPEKEKEEL